MSVRQIIRKIGDVVKDTHTPRHLRIENLQHLAMMCWSEVLPEAGTAALKKLEAGEIELRWAQVREEVENYARDKTEYRDMKFQILYVLDWPASGGNFYWVGGEE